MMESEKTEAQQQWECFLEKVYTTAPSFSVVSEIMKENLFVKHNEEELKQRLFESTMICISLMCEIERLDSKIKQLKEDYFFMPKQEKTNE